MNTYCYANGHCSPATPTYTDTVLTNEAGLHLDHRTNLANNIATFEQPVLPGRMISKKYADVPPKIAIEVDIEADVVEMTESGYIHKKRVNCLRLAFRKSFGC